MTSPNIRQHNVAKRRAKSNYYQQEQQKIQCLSVGTEI